MMIMSHNGWDKRCPYCLSRKLEVINYDLAAPQFHERFGQFWFKLKCKKCGGICEDITNLESTKELKEKVEQKRQSREALDCETLSSE